MARLRGGDDGAVAVIVAIMAVVLFGIGAFTVDYGMAYANRRAMSTGADGAALAGARTMQLAATTTDTCATLLTNSAAVGQAKSDAQGYVSASAPVGTTAATTISCDATGRLTVTVTTSRTDEAILGGVFGATNYDLNRTATAMVAPAVAISGLRPFALCAGAANELVSAGYGTAKNIPLTKFNTNDCGSAPGNWGTVDLDVGSNGTPDTREWISDGYNGQIALGSAGTIIIDGDPGFPSGGSIGSNLNSILGKPIVLPVYSSVSGSGANSKYTVDGFVAAQFCAWRMNPRNGTDTGSATSCYDSALGMPSADGFQLRLDRFIPVGEISDTCGIGAPACKYSPLLVKLVV